MAKGLRSSVKKANKSRLRDRVFGPAEDARKERLSAKLLELAMRPAEKDHKKEGIAATKPDAEEAAKEDAQLDDPTTIVDENAMDVEEAEDYGSSRRGHTSRKGRVQKKGRTKASSSAVFSTWKRGVRVGPRTNGRRRK